MHVPSQTTHNTSRRRAAGTTIALTQKASTRAVSRTSIVEAYERLDMKGTALSKFKMNQASVLDVGRTATRGILLPTMELLPTLTWPPKLLKVLYSLTEVYSLMEKGSRNSLSSSSPPSSSIESIPAEWIVSDDSLGAFTINDVNGSRAVPELLSDELREPKSLVSWSSRIVPAVPVGATRSSHPAGRAEVCTTYRRAFTRAGNFSNSSKGV
mmetsp:Transcript_9185/g.13306  ORF Transcript_9185/g.13306 Transcript_9185/m.13306 type:complete len:212 (+) Transcript_9185:1934-2569(+)